MDVEMILRDRLERAITEHQWIDPQGETTCTCGWTCRTGEYRFSAHRSHLAGVLLDALLGLQSVTSGSK